MITLSEFLVSILSAMADQKARFHSSSSIDRFFEKDLRWTPLFCIILSPVPMINHEVSGGEYDSRNKTDNFAEVIMPGQTQEELVKSKLTG